MIDRIHSLIPSVPPRLLEPEAFVAARAIADPRLVQVRDQWSGASNLLVCGESGIGKSLCLAMAARRLAAGRARGHDLPLALWVRGDEISRNPQRESVTRAKKARLLVIDDFEWSKRPDVLFEILASRYDRSLTTATTSGLTALGFVKRFGDAVLRRAIEPGHGALVDLWEPFEEPTDASVEEPNGPGQAPPMRQLPLAVGGGVANANG